MRKPIYNFAKRSDKRHKISWVLFAIAVIIFAYLKYTRKQNVLLIIIGSSLVFIGWILSSITEKDIVDSFRLRKSERTRFFRFKKSKSSTKDSKKTNE